MKIRHLIILLGLMLAVCTLKADAQWVGTYEFGEDGGKTAGGTAIYVHHELVVTEGDEGLMAFLKSNGYQTSKDLICKVKTEGTKLLIYFETYGEDNVFESYKPGDLLLTLERKTEKGKPVLLTHWGKFTPIVSKHERSGKVYFNKTASDVTELK